MSKLEVLSFVAILEMAKDIVLVFILADLLGGSGGSGVMSEALIYGRGISSEYHTGKS